MTSSVVCQRFDNNLFKNFHSCTFSEFRTVLAINTFPWRSQIYGRLSQTFGLTYPHQSFQASANLQPSRPQNMMYLYIHIITYIIILSRCLFSLSSEKTRPFFMHFFLPSPNFFNPFISTHFFFIFRINMHSAIEYQTRAPVVVQPLLSCRGPRSPPYHRTANS